MNTYKWTILDATSNDGLITHAKYMLEASDGQNTVQSEGNWYFSNPVLTIPYEDVTELNIAEWIEKDAVIDGICHIKSNIDKQLSNLAQNNKSELPWLSNTFTLGS